VAWQSSVESRPVRNLQSNQSPSFQLTLNRRKMSDTEEQGRPVNIHDSDSSEDEGPLQRGGAGGLKSKLNRSASDSEEDEAVQDSTTDSSAPKVEGVSKDDETDSEAEVERDEEEDEDRQKQKQVDSSDTEEEKEVEVRKVKQQEEDDEDIDFDDLPVISTTAAEEERADSPASRSPSPEKDRSPSPAPVDRRSPSPAPVDRRSASPVDRRSASPAPVDRSRSNSPERKSSQGSSSFDDERASSMSPEPAAVISTPHTKVTSPTSNSSQKDITKIYTEGLVNEVTSPTGDKFVREKPAIDITQIYTASHEVTSPTGDKFVRAKPASDITQIYTASLHKEHQSPKLERARGGKPVKDITQLYTAAFNKPEAGTEMSSPNRPRRNADITKLYTGGFEKENNESSFKSKPRDEITNPRKHNMATSLDREAIRDAYTQVMSDNNGVEWAAFKFDENNTLVVGGTGDQFDQFKAMFGPDDRGFGYIKIQTGDEMSKRSRFCLITWVGANVSVMKKAKMSTDRLLVKEVIQNLSVELQLENSYEFSMDHLKTEVDKAGGARYGTGVRVE